MDKRTFLFVLSLSLTLFAVNMFFQQGSEEKTREWRQQQEAKKAAQIQALEQEIAKQTVQAKDLPLVDIFADANGTTLLTAGVESNGFVLTLSWNKTPPEAIYSRKQGSQQKPERLSLGYASNTKEGLVVYQKEPGKALPIGHLPSFGSFDLQVVTLFPENKERPVKVTPGRYTDGSFSTLKEDLAKLKNEEATPQNAIILLKTTDGFLPVAVYQQELPSFLYLDYIQDLPTEVAKPKTDRPGEKVEEKFYVIENNYQQLVFSNYGAALVEINLPFQTDANEKSVVKEIAFDREMLKDHPYNAHFPTHAYYSPGFKEHPQGKLGGYYPLLRRDLIQVGDRKSVRVHPRFYALNIVSEYPEMAELVYEVTHFDESKIVFEAKQQRRRIIKTFSFDTEKNAPYIVDLTVKIEGDAKGLWLTSGVPEVELISGSPAPALKYRLTRGQKVEVINSKIPKETLADSSIYPDWLCNSNGFLGMILDPLTEIDAGYRMQPVSGTAVPSRIVEIGEDYERFKPQDLPGYMTMLPLKGSGGIMNFRIFAGPFASNTLKAVDKIYSDSATGYNPDYIASQSFHGWFSFISEPFAKFLFILMNFFHSITNSWALSIVLLTVALRVMLYPLNAWSTKSMVKMQEVTPKVTAIQQKYKKDPKKVQLEIMNLYRDAGVNPLSGCFPLLIQMPFLIGMFDLLKSTFELRGASFIPGWIDNLTAPDVLFSWDTPIFFIGTEFHLLPLLLGAVMFFQQKMSSTGPKDPSQMTDQQKQQQAMGKIMPILFTVMFYRFPSGLNIYWLSSMLLGILQQWWTTKRLKAKKAVGQVKA